MKTKLTLLASMLMVLFLWSSPLMSQVPIVTTAGSLIVCPGATNVEVPITVNDFNSVNSISLTLIFDNTHMTYTGYTVSPLLAAAGGFVLVNNPPDKPHKIIAAWFGLNPLTLPANTVLFTFKFNVNASSALTWDLITQGACQYSDFNGDPLPAEWVNGQVTASPADANISSTPAVCPGEDATVTVDFTAGIAPFTFVYNDGVNPADTVVTSDDPYIFTQAISVPTTWTITYITSSQGCANTTISKSTTTSIIPLPSSYNVTGGGSICLGGSGVAVGLDGSDIGVNYDLLLDGTSTGIILTGTGQALDFGLQNVAGTYTVFAYNDCDDLLMSGSALITISPGPTVTLEPFAPMCENDDPQTLIGGMPEGGVYSGIGVDNGIFYPALVGAGVYTITYTYTDLYGCFGSASQDITVNQVYSLYFEPFGPVCINAVPVLLSAQPEGGVFSGPGVIGNTFDPSAAGIGTWELYYTYTSLEGCVSSTSTEVTVLALTDIIFDPIAPVCINGEAVVLAASPGGGYFEGPGVINNVFYPSESGIGTFTITYIYLDGNGCTNTASQDITVLPLPVVTLDALGPFCIDADPVLMTGLPSGGVYFGDGVIGDMFDPATAGAGIHTITYTFTDENGCTNSASIYVEVFDLPVVSFDPVAPLCANADPVILTAYPEGGVFSGTGVDNGMFYPAVSGPGSFIITYTYTDANGCVNTAVQEIMVYPLTVLTFNPLPAVCVTAEAIDLNLYVDPLGGYFSGAGVYNNFFYPGITGAGVHTITYTYNDENGCTVMASQDITVFDLPVVSLDPVGPFCIDHDPVVLNGLPEGGEYLGPGITGNVFSPMEAGVGLHALIYTYTDPNGCSNLASIEVNVNPLPFVGLSSLPDMCLNAAPVALEGFPTGGLFAGPGVDNGMFDPMIAGVGSHTIVYTYTDENSCTNSATIVVNVLPLTLITINPADAELDETGIAFFNGEAENATSYQWQLSTDAGLNWSDLGDDFMYNGVYTNQLQITGVTLEMSGYLYRLKALGLCEPVAITNSAMLSVNPIIVTFAGSSIHCLGDQVIVPVTAEHFYGVAAMSLTLNYDDTQLEYVGYQALNAEFNSGVIEFNAIGSQVRVGFFTLTPANIGDGLLFELLFNATGAYSDLVWDIVTPGNCEYKNLDDEIITAVYMNGNVLINPLPEINFQPLPSVCITSAPVTLVAYPEGGIFSGTGVSGNMFDPAIAGLGTFTLSYTYTDPNSCTNVAYQDITVGELPEIVFPPLADVCLNADPVLLVAQPSGGYFSGQGVIGDYFYPNLAGVGTFTITYYYDAGGNCVGSGPQTITVLELPVVIIDPVGPFCEGVAAVELTGYPEGGEFSGVGVANGFFDPALAGPGVWTIAYTYTDPNGCTGVATTDVTVYSPVQVSINLPIYLFCLDADPVTMTGFPEGGLFSGPGVIGSEFYPALAGAGTWTITYSFQDENGCTGTASAEVTVYDLPVITFDPLGIVCCNAAPVQLTALPAGGYFSGPAVSGDYFDPAIAGVGTFDITYIYTDMNGCTNAATQQIMVVCAPQVTFYPYTGPLCANSAPITLVATPEGGVFSGTGVVGNTFDPSISGVGTFTVTYVYVDQYGCSSSSYQEITVNEIPNAELSTTNNLVCTGAMAVLTVTASSGTPPFIVTFDDGTQYTLNAWGLDIDVYPTQTTTYTLTGIVDAFGCSNVLNSSVTITVEDPASIFNVTGGGAYCEGGNGVTVSLDGSVQGFTYHLYLDGNNTGLWQDGTGTQLDFTNNTAPGNYTVLAMSNNGCETWMAGSADVIVNTGLLVDAGPDQTIPDGGSAMLSVAVSGGTEPYTYSWTPAASLDDPSSATPLASPLFTTTYTVVVTDAAGCNGTDEVTVFVIGAVDYISGILTYQNVPATPLDNVKVILTDVNGINPPQEQYTATDGSYVFNDLPYGTYMLSAECNKAWGGGNAADGLLMLRHFTGQQILTDLKLAAGEVTGNGVINAHDALNTLRRYVGYIANYAPLGDWVFENPVVIIDGINVADGDFQGLCRSDVNGDYVPPFGKLTPTISVEHEGTVYINANGIVDLPVVSEQALTLGAFSMIINLPDGYQVIDVTMNQAVGTLLFKAEGNVLRLGWYSIEPIRLAAGQAVFTLKLSATGIHGQLSLDASSTFSDDLAQTINGVKLRIPKLAVLNASMELFSYPNPSNSVTRLSYTLPLEGQTNISLYNVLGEQVEVMLNEYVSAGTHTLTFDASILNPGVYFIRMNVAGTSEKVLQFSVIR